MLTSTVYVNYILYTTFQFLIILSPRTKKFAKRNATFDTLDLASRRFDAKCFFIFYLILRIYGFAFWKDLIETIHFGTPSVIY